MTRNYEIYEKNKYLDTERYPEVRSLAGGGSGVVTFHGNDLEAVAMKKFKTKNAQREFLYEVECYKNLGHHENVVKFIEAFSVAGEFFIVMEYCECGDLRNIYEDYPSYTEEDVRDIIVQITKGLMHLNARKFVHRDIKPANIFVRNWGPEISVAIGDFNFSKQAEGDRLTCFVSELGTGLYKAPEMLLNIKYNQKCDVWSTGVMLYRLLSGKQNPFVFTSSVLEIIREDMGKLSKQEENEIVHQLIKEMNKIDFAKHLEKVSEEGKRIVKKMLTGDFKKRIDLPQILQSKWANKVFPDTLPELYEE